MMYKEGRLEGHHDVQRKKQRLIKRRETLERSKTETETERAQEEKKIEKERRDRGIN